jgi:hypothetical protein
VARFFDRHCHFLCNPDFSLALASSTAWRPILIPVRIASTTCSLVLALQAADLLKTGTELANLESR